MNEKTKFLKKLIIWQKYCYVDLSIYERKIKFLKISELFDIFLQQSAYL